MAQQPTRKARKGMAITALVLGIVAFCGSPVPILNNATIVCGFIGLVFGGIAVFGRHWVMAIVGLVLAVAGIAAGLILQAQWSKQLDQIGHDIKGGSSLTTPVMPSAPALPAAPASTEAASNDVPTATVDHWEFEVTTTGSGIQNVTYMKPGFNLAQDNDVKGKSWSTSIDGDYGYLTPNLTAQNKGSGTITCTIKHNGQVVTTNSSKGAYAVVTCQ